ncbi:MAG: hypothetical protein FWE47_00875 [Oscillospiraceae bacterium]|nr:hypothetical protein [Oscillospiraceae bacterium]
MEVKFNDYFADKLEILAGKIEKQTVNLQEIIEDENALEAAQKIFEKVDYDFKNACFDIFEAADVSEEWREDENLLSNIKAILDEVKDSIVQMKYEILSLIVPSLHAA